MKESFDNRCPECDSENVTSVHFGGVEINDDYCCNEYVCKDCRAHHWQCDRNEEDENDG